MMIWCVLLASVAAASQARIDRQLAAEIDGRVTLLLSNYQAVTADPKKMAYLRPLLAHYAKDPHPFAACVKDNMKRFGPGRTEGICAVIKDTIRQTTGWRHGHNCHSKVPDAGSPGVGIAEADKGAAHWGGHNMSLLDHLDGEIGVIDHSVGILDALHTIELLGRSCDVYRVLLGLDEPPVLNLVEV